MRRSFFSGIGLAVLAVIAIAIYLSVFIVGQTQQALVLRFGEPVRVITSPGLNYKIPLIDNVSYFDKRILDLDSPPLEIIASDQKRLVVDAFGRYRIVNPLTFFQSVGTIPIADSRLSTILNSAVRRVLGDATFIQLVRDERADLMSRITAQVNGEAQNLGIDVVDVKIRRADLPEANSQAIYQRMQTEREREATEIRAEGEQAARRIRAQADRQATVIVAEADRESEQLRGDGDAERNRIFAAAFGKDPEFFAFYRSMQAYQQGLQPSDTRFVLSPDSEFFRYFNEAVALPTGGPPEPVSPDAQTSEGAPTDGAATQSTPAEDESGQTVVDDMAPPPSDGADAGPGEDAALPDNNAAASNDDVVPTAIE